MRFGKNAYAGLLVLRVAVGLVFVMHGWTKIFGMQTSFVQEMLHMAGWTLPASLLWLVAVLELVGGLALVVGKFTRPFAVLLVVEMVVAVILFHARQGFFIASVPNAPLAYGLEYHITLVAGLACIALAGPGVWSLDERRASGPEQ
jgi:putative oxidoreductase